MISPECESYVRQLLVAGVSQREVARKAGVARGTVVAIAKGDRRERCAIRTADGSHVYEPEDPERVDRCGTCGARVVMPCLKCFLRSVRGVFGRKR